MRFSLQDVKKSIQRRGGELFVSLHFLREGELHTEIERLIAYYERILGQVQRDFSLDEARACIGDYRLAHCLIATLSKWYSWRQREWTEAVLGLASSSVLTSITSPIQLRLALYTYVNQHHQGFLTMQTRTESLQSFAANYHLNVSDLEFLLLLDSEDEALLVRETVEPPTAQEVILLYNQWVFESALFNSSSVSFVIDCQAFSRRAAQMPSQSTTPLIGMGVGAVIKRLTYLARVLGVYYDLAYEADGQKYAGGEAPLLLTLYGPQEVTGTPQHYGLRLARLCRLLLGYNIAQASGRPKRGAKASLATTVIEAEAKVHFLQRAYTFIMDAHVLKFIGLRQEASELDDAPVTSPQNSVLFDSGIEQAFSEAFLALADSRGIDGWELEREPEPLLLPQSIFIPDFALTRGERRIYVEILGFWTPAYRERKIQKLQQLRGRDELLLAIPVEAREAFASIEPDFPIVFYDGQLSVTEVLQVLRSRYDDFGERLALIDVPEVRQQVEREGLLSERVCYDALHCYRRSEVQQAAALIVDANIAFVPGIGLYHLDWIERLKTSFLAWMDVRQATSLPHVLNALKKECQVLQRCEDSTVEALVSLWPEIRIRRDSIFDIQVELVGQAGEAHLEELVAVNALPMDAEKAVKRLGKEKRSPVKKRVVKEREALQDDLWG